VVCEHGTKQIGDQLASKAQAVFKLQKRRNIPSPLVLDILRYKGTPIQSLVAALLQIVVNAVFPNLSSIITSTQKRI
jgi:hypothetical protein